MSSFHDPQMEMPADPQETRRTQRLLGTPLFVLMAIAITAAPATTQDREILEVRVVSSESGQGIATARVGTPQAEAWTDGDGVAVLVLHGAGSVTLEVERIGFRGRTAVVALPAARRSVTLLLDPSPIRLAPVRVGAPARSTWLAEFERRQRTYHGATFLGPADIDRMRPMRVSDVLRRVRGLRVECGFGGCRAVNNRVGGQAGLCPIQFFVDGVPVHGYRPDDMPAPDLEAVEVYRGAANLPPELNRGSARCGAVVVWSRDPSRAARR